MARPNQTAARNEALSRAENLYRQIEAENPDNFDRIAEAQRAIDAMLVMRRALANAVRASVMSRTTSIRMEIMEFMMMEGQCPGESFVRGILARRPGELELRGSVGEASQTTRYTIEESASRVSVDILCSPNGVEMVEATGARSIR